MLKTGSLLMSLAGAACHKFPEWRYFAQLLCKNSTYSSELYSDFDEKISNNVYLT